VVASPPQRSGVTMRAPLLAFLLALLAAPTPGPPPQVTVEPDTVTVGDRLTVQLAGWPAGNVLIELCGNRGAGGSTDCAVASSVQTHVPDSGAAAAVLPVAAPPVPCPCAVRVRDLPGAVTAAAPIAVAGAPTGAVDPREPGSLPGGGGAPQRGAGGESQVTDVSVSGGWSWPALFGGPARRTVTFTVDNPGGTPVTEPQLMLLLGRGDHPTAPVDAPDLESVPPGGHRTYQVPVTLPAPTFGTYTVRGEVAGAAFLAETTTYPWGLTIALAALVAATVLFRLLRRAN
jgi:hypothetical protein